MTLYHNSPRTGKAARCRAKIQCLYGTTHGTTIRRDGTVEVGTGGSTWSSLPNPPSEHGSDERIIIDPRDGKVKNIWSVDNRDLRNTTPTNTTVEKVAKKAADEQDDINDIDFGAEIGKQRYVGGQKASTKGSTTMKNDEKVEGEAGRDENDIDNIDFGAEVYDGNRMSTGDETPEAPTNATVEEESSAATSDRTEHPKLERFQKVGLKEGTLYEKEYEPLPEELVNNVYVWDEKNFSVGYRDNAGNEMRLDFEDGYLTRDSLSRWSGDFSMKHSLQFSPVQYSFEEKINQQRGRNARYDEIIERGWGRDFFYLMNEDDAKEAAQTIADNENERITKSREEDYEPMTPKRMNDHMKQWKDIELADEINMNETDEDMRTIRTLTRSEQVEKVRFIARPCTAVLPENIMKAWKKYHY